MTYGINERSVLNDINHYHVSNSQMPQDVMHILFEGVIPKEVKLMLNMFINDKKYFTLQFLNERIRCFSYGRSEAKNKPPKIFDMQHITENQKLPLSGEYNSMHDNMHVICFLFSYSNVDSCNPPSTNDRGQGSRR